MSCGVQYASRSHEEQALVEYVGKSMSGGCVDGDLRPYSYRRHHITYLANYAVGEDAPNVVLQHSVDNSIQSHHHSRPDQDIPTREAPGQSVDCGLGGKSAHEDAPGDGSLGIGVRKPGVEGRHCCVDGETHQDKPPSDAGINMPKGQGARAPGINSVSYTHLRAHETDSYLVCRLLLEKKKKQKI